MPRIVGIDVPNDKPVWIALTYIYGIGPHLAREILRKPRFLIRFGPKNSPKTNSAASAVPSTEIMSSKVSYAAR